MKGRYKVVARKNFRSALCNTLQIKNYPASYMEGVEWTLARDPRAGPKLSSNVRVIQVIWAPIVVNIYYTINDAAKTVYLMDVTL